MQTSTSKASGRQAGPTPLEQARALKQAGISFVPIALDGSKAPDGPLLPLIFDEDTGRAKRSWTPFQQRLPGDDEITTWYDRPDPRGIATVGGEVSGHLEHIDFDTAADVIFPQWQALVEAERPGLVARLNVVRSPRQPLGMQVRYRCRGVTIPGNDKLAVDPSRPARERTLIETRGEGGYCLCPGCPPACHVNARTYDHISGPPLTELPEISPEEREVLIRCARAFDLSPREEPAKGAGLRPGEDFDRRGPAWDTIIGPAGWKRLRTVGAVEYWQRPEKDGKGWSATSGYCKGKDGTSLFRVFSSNAHPFEEGKSYGKFRALALLKYKGDLAAAARDLAGQGYGDGTHRGNGQAGPKGGHTPSPPDPPDFEGPPRPVRVDLLPVPPLPEAMIPGPLRGWLTDIARRGCFPLEYPTAAAFVSLSALVGRKVAIRPKRHDDWLVIPNSWGAIVGHPGIQKTPAVTEAMLPLNRLVADAIAAHEQAMAEFQASSLVAKARAKAAKDALEKTAKGARGKGAGANEAELEALAREALAGDDAKPPPLKRYVVNDSSVEKLGELLAENPNGLLLFRDELIGFLRTLDKEGHENDKGFFLEGWNGTGSYVYDRIGRGTIIIPVVCLSVFGTIQPGPLARYLRAAMTDNDGLVNRFQLLLYPDPPKTWANVDRYPDTAAKTRAYDVFKALDGLDGAGVGAEVDEDRNVPFLRFAPDAQDLFDGWRADLENRLRGGEDSPVMQSHLSKYRSLMPSLALVFHLVDVVGGQGAGPVSLAAALAAAAWCDLLDAHARRAYQSALGANAEGALALCEHLKKGALPNPFKANAVAHKGWSGLTTAAEVGLALGVLEDRGWVKGLDVPSGPAGGRPTIDYWVHPDIVAAAERKGQE
jgi:hypothetical protein